ncbi:MAG: TatD family hydrolase [Candidatus Thorarchaeota archaeon]
MKLFDAHTHIDMKHFQNDIEKVIARAQKQGLIGMVTSSIGTGSFRRTLGIIQKHRGYVHHSAGCSVSQLTRNEADSIISLIQKYSSEIVAIGEVGLDYHWIKDSQGRKAQEPLFRDFIELATELDLPLVIHSRKAEAEATEILEQAFSGSVLMHCFDGTPEIAKRIADNGWSITLPANFQRSKNRVQAASILPLEQIMLETDAPYLSPTDDRRNEPSNVSFGCSSLANLLNLPEEDVASTTTSNALRYYNISFHDR